MSRQYEYRRAETLDEAWVNFEHTLPLDPLPDGGPNPFYVERPGNPAQRLRDSLLAPFLEPPKFFFSGHRGTGKSTELRRLAADPEIRAKYYPIHFTIRDRERDRKGYETMREFVRRRMNPELITRKALDEAVRLSGGVFSEMARIMRAAIQRARPVGRIQVEHVKAAEAEIRGEYRRILTSEQRALLRRLHERQCLDEPDRIAPLLQLLAVLEYANGEPWCDIHPALEPLLHEEAELGRTE